MIPIISIVGKSGSGKTKFLTKLIPELNKRGYKIGVIKHDVHSQIDLPGKDSWKISQSGAQPVLIAGPKKMALIQSLGKEYNLDQLSTYCPDADLILTEGYKKENKPKIEIYSSGRLLCKQNELLAIVGRDKSTPLRRIGASKIEIKSDTPWFKFNEISKIADLLEKKFLPRTKMMRGKLKKVNLFLDQQVVPLNPFVQGFISSTVGGMLKSLKRINKKAKKIDLLIWR